MSDRSISASCTPDRAGCERPWQHRPVRELEPDAIRSTVAIGRLQAAYADAVSRQAWPDVTACFEPDAVVRIDVRAAEREPFELVGPDELVAFIARALEPFTFFEMAILNATVEPDGGTATGRVYICELRCDAEGGWTEAYGVYHDRYRRTDDGWRIAGRQYHSLARRGPTTEGLPFPPGPIGAT